MREDANKIIKVAIAAAMPDEAVKKALARMQFQNGRVVLVAVGKASWQMARTAMSEIGDRISEGVVITKYDHSNGPIPGLEIFEAGHPIPDENSFKATERAISLVSNLSKEDTVLLLISGGGSALFEKPLISAESLDEVTRELLASSADIVEMNTIRKRLSAVKGGKFALLCEPASVKQIILSDIIGDPLDMIASGPAYPDASTSEQAIAICEKYHLKTDKKIQDLLKKETPYKLSNVETYVTGSVRQLCLAAEETCRKLGYEPLTLCAGLCCEASEAGTFLANIAQFYQDTDRNLAFIAGGETVVHLTGTGKGGRNQELALSAARGIDGMENVAIFSVGSDGTDGPTDAAGGYADGNTVSKLRALNVDIHKVLADNDAYHALEKTGGLIITGATGTNVNDLSCLLIRKKIK